MNELSQAETVLRDELKKLSTSILNNIQDPIHRQQAEAIAVDLAILPLRLARGEDIKPLLAAIKAEAANRTLEVRVEAETAAVRAWISLAQRVIIGAITTALA